MAIKFLNSVAVDADVLFVDTANERVGIGTTSPSEKLHVVGGSGLIESTTYADAGFTVSDDIYDYRIGTTPPQIRTNYIAIKRSASSTYFNQSSGNFVWNTGLSEKMRITSAGNVGIGTTSPSDKLEVAGGGRFEGMTVKGTNSSYWLYDRDLTNRGQESFRITRNAGNVTFYDRTYSGGYEELDFLKFSHSTSGSSTLSLKSKTTIDFLINQSNVARINSSGNVGIGTTSPDYPLHVDATIKIGDRQGTDGSLILQSQQGPNITFKSTGDVLDISGTTGATNGNSIRLSDNIKKLYFNGGIGGTIAINRGNRGLMDSNVGGLEVQQQDTASSNGKSTFLSTSSSGTILRSTSYGGTGTSGDIQFQFGGGANASEPSPTTKMVIKNSGNVGIGTTSPTGILDVLSTDAQRYARFRAPNGEERFQFYIGSTGNSSVLNMFQSDGATQGVKISSQGTSYFNGGNVGIGTTSPSEKLEVAGDMNLYNPSSTSQINFRNIAGANYIKSNGYSTHFGLRGNTGNGVFIIEDSLASAQDIRIKPTTSGWDFSSRGVAGVNALLTIDSVLNISNKTNVGIGTTSPTEKLHVAGNARVTGAYYDSGNTPGTANQLLASTATGTAWIDPSTIVAEAATLVVIACKNTSGATIAQGTPVYQTGTVGATATIEIAPADALISANKLPAIGLLQTALNNNGFGNVVITGELTNFTTDPIDGLTPTVGDKVFVKSGGGLTLTKPTGEGNGIQNMGLVGKVSGGNSGSITVSSIMRTNDVPNLPEGRIWVGDGNTIVSDTVFLDETNGRLGIETTNPRTALEVLGKIRVWSGANSHTYVETSSGSNLGSIQGKKNSDNAVRSLALNPLGGNVGINLGAGIIPSEDLQVQGSARIQADSNNFLKITTSQTATTFANSGNGIASPSMSFNTGADTRLTILGINGNVGIGTTSPSFKLEVAGAGKFTGQVTIPATPVATTDAASKSYVDAQVGTADTLSEVLALGNTSGTNDISMLLGQRIYFNNDGENIRSIVNGDLELNSRTDLRIKANNNGTTGVGLEFWNGGSEKMRVNSDGNVGIGTTSPSYKLQVAGGISAGGKVTYSKAAGILDTTGYAVAGLTTASNGQSAGFTFTCFGHTGKYQKIVYSCWNAGGTWNTSKVIDEGTNDFDIEASANGTTITFTFKSRSGSKSYTPRVTVEATGSAINNTYA